ncbi:MAG TPA: hypothetical protein VLJ62_04420, partial [Burkholderiaceae bacterium]|nr:hypothetical protein [Burkholderiaceae bacterium]
TRRLLNLIRAMVHERAARERVKPSDVRFTRKDIRDATQWSDSQLKLHCARLADMEYLLIHAGNRGHSLSYELLWDGGADGGDGAERRRHLCGLLDPGQLDGEDRDAQLRPAQVWADGEQVEAKSTPSLGQVWHKSGLAKPPQIRANAGDAADAPINGAKPHIKAAATSTLAAVVVTGTH